MTARDTAVALVAWLALTAQAAPLGLPAPPDMAFAPIPGRQLPADLIFRDDDGRPVRLQDLTRDRPLVLVPGYYRCPNLCSTVMDGVLESLVQAHLPRDAWRVAAVSIDSRETVAVAAAKKPHYAALLAATGGDLHMLTGDAGAVAALMRAIGMRTSPLPDGDQIAHPAGLVVLTPDGRIARAFSGVRFDAAALRTAIEQAAAGRVGSPAQQLLMRCVHFDPQTGRYTMTILDGIRILFLSAFAALGIGWRWRAGRRRGRPS
ncbi:Cytochrome oxidase biogenesis protein Sco1/SenC/PrrC [Cupriavidus sp. U2]|uniref:SCO family protein n=1 Tax=Cupriavidus sp. U2 TaxID=2920269 RepID=UPI00129DB3CF|nr:SCO family protein [Cupriavidus sp. U2]KAI3593175.1 Cytochrome oxidase biogenesis protein Sco1/SenC/PrrC [Cupriavidus sp. U2]